MVKINTIESEKRTSVENRTYAISKKPKITICNFDA